jgi:hypothetical protein
VNKSAQQLGRLGKGKPKQLTTEEIERRKTRLAEARAKRWPGRDERREKNNPSVCKCGREMVLASIAEKNPTECAWCYMQRKQREEDSKL